MSHAEQTEAEFEAKFTTVNIPGTEEVYWGLHQLGAIPHKRIWTVTEAEGNLFILAGDHLVNRFGYVVTEEPWETYGDTYEWQVLDGEDQPCEWGHTDRPCAHDDIRNEHSKWLDGDDEDENEKLDS